MPYAIRPFDRDFAGVVPLLNRINPRPMTPEEMEQAHAEFPADGLRHRLVAVDGDGTVVGYASAVFLQWHRPGRFFVNLITAPHARRQGAGSALLARAEAWSWENGAKDLLVSLTDEDEAVAFARHRGFEAEHYTLTNRLDLPTFDESGTGLAGVVDAVEGSGIRFSTYPDHGEAIKQRLYELYKITDLDTPGYIGTDPALYPSFAKWHEEIFGNETTIPEGIVIAADGDRLVGLTILQRTGNEGGLYTEYTGVRREYRRRGIGLALKLLSVRFARSCGAPYMTTRNSAFNASMLAVNQKMGYVKTEGRYWMVKKL